jgi:hypothetical protein
MGIAFGNNNAAEMYFGDKTVAEVYFGNKLVWSGKTLLMGNDKYVCIEYTPDEDTVVSTITVFMNTDEPTQSNDAWMWVIDEAGITVGFSTTSSEGSEEIRYKLAGYEHTNSFSNLTLKAGKKYYICHKISQWDQGDHFFAYFKNKPGNYKLYNVYGNSQNPFVEADHKWIGKLSDANVAADTDKVVTATSGDYFLWDHTSGAFSANTEYYRNGTTFSQYQGIIGSDTFHDVDSIMRLSTDDKFVWSGLSLHGITAGNLYKKTSNLDSYTYRGCIDDNGIPLKQLQEILKLNDGSFTVSSNKIIDENNINARYAYTRTTACTGNYWTTPPEAQYITCDADAYKYVFDILTGGNTGWNACVWETNYVYTSGKIYKRGDAYTGQNYSGYFNERAATGLPAYRVDTLEKAVLGNGTLSPSAGELVFLEVHKEKWQSYEPWYNSLMVRSNEQCNKIVTNDTSWTAPKTIANLFLETISGDVFAYEGTQIYGSFNILNNNIYARTASANLAFTALDPITAEPANPQQNTIYYKGPTQAGTWHKNQYEYITDENLVTWDGTYWQVINVGSYFSNNNKTIWDLYNDATQSGDIMKEVQLSQIMTQQNPPTSLIDAQDFTVKINQDTNFVTASVSSDKKHYLAINGQEV